VRLAVAGPTGGTIALPQTHSRFKVEKEGEGKG